MLEFEDNTFLRNVGYHKSSVTASYTRIPVSYHITAYYRRNKRNNNNKKKNKKTKNIFLIDMAVPNTHNLAKTITDKQNKHQELVNEICAMWKQNRAQVIPLVISSTGVIPKLLPQSLKRLNLHPNTYIQMQKYVILGTCSIVRKFLNYK
jgi:hypothetical protein